MSDDYLIPISSDGGVPVTTSFRSFRPSCSEPRPDPQTCTNDVRNSEPSNKDLDQETNGTLLFLFFSHLGHNGCINKVLFLINSNGIIKQARLSVRKAIKWPNGRKIILKFNRKLQSIRDGSDLLSGIFGLLVLTIIIFFICDKIWRKINTKDKIYNDGIKNDTMSKLYHEYYDSMKALEQNIEEHPPKIDKKHWRWFLAYRNKLDIHATYFKFEKYCELIETTIHSYYQFKKLGEAKRIRGRKANRRELWNVVHKQSDGSYIHEKARAIGVTTTLRFFYSVGKIVEIEQHDESSKVLSKNDLLAQALVKENSSRVHGMSFGLTPSQVFSSNLHQPGDGAQTEETQRVLFELQADVVDGKLKK
ncbi:hypothetical protein Ahy_B10g104364 [Arachis hypogaea]|uniref:Uncharacterized protein n=1 Tax=Arachis hypogaea TaxID=3818 RepID=A0A444X5B9_ARAHY|nr:hypothetical protein Ahy_B10g104364 [Arachis hypogaea]